MPSLGDRIDLSVLTTEQLEQIGQYAFGQTRVTSYLPVLMGLYLDTICLGLISVLFVYWWMNARSTEKRWIKYLIYYLAFCACASSAWLLAYAKFIFTYGFGTFRNLLNLKCVIGSCVRIPATFFFVHRAYRLCNKALWPFFVIAPMQACLFSIGLIIAIRIQHLELITNYALAVTACAVDLIGDLILTSTILIQLYRSMTGWRGTDELIKNVLISFAEAQAPVTLLAVTYVVIQVEYFNTTYALALLFYPKIVIICILIVSLSRVRLRGQISKHKDQSKTMNSKTREHTRFSAIQGGSGSSGDGNGRITLVEQDGGSSKSRIGQLPKSDSTRDLGVGVISFGGSSSVGQRSELGHGARSGQQIGQTSTLIGTDGGVVEGDRSTTRLVPSSVESLPAAGVGKK